MGQGLIHQGIYLLDFTLSKESQFSLTFRMTTKNSSLIIGIPVQTIYDGCYESTFSLFYVYLDDSINL